MAKDLKLSSISKTILFSVITSVGGWWGYKMAKAYLADENREIDILARTIYGEARGEGVEGMEAVASVVMNRVKKGYWWGDTVETVAKKPFQFSTWNENDPNLSVILSANENDPSFVKALEIAKDYYYNYDKIQDKTGGATHYHTAQINPYWAKDLTQTTQIGNHIFYV